MRVLIIKIEDEGWEPYEELAANFLVNMLTDRPRHLLDGAFDDTVGEDVLEETPPNVTVTVEGPFAG